MEKMLILKILKLALLRLKTSVQNTCTEHLYRTPAQNQAVVICACARQTKTNEFWRIWAKTNETEFGRKTGEIGQKTGKNKQKTGERNRTLAKQGETQSFAKF